MLCGVCCDQYRRYSLTLHPPRMTLETIFHKHMFVALRVARTPYMSQCLSWPCKSVFFACLTPVCCHLNMYERTDQIGQAKLVFVGSDGLCDRRACCDATSLLFVLCDSHQRRSMANCLLCMSNSWLLSIDCRPRTASNWTGKDAMHGCQQLNVPTVCFLLSLVIYVLFCLRLGLIAILYVT